MRMGSDESGFDDPFIVWGKSHEHSIMIHLLCGEKVMNNSFQSTELEKRQPNPGIEQSSSVYQPNALPPAQPLTVRTLA